MMESAHTTLPQALHAIPLEGCRTIPLAHYLKGLGVLRTLAEQADPKARAEWRRGHLTIHTALSRAALSAFFLERYTPTPIVSPWNGGSGFYEGESQDHLEAFTQSEATRWADYAAVIQSARDVLQDLGLTSKIATDQKPMFVDACRARFPEPALPWLDAALILTNDDLKFPPLLGTGGNDGRLEFSRNFMQRLADVFDLESGAPTPASAEWLESALFGAPKDGMKDNAIGQFYPNASTLNPWDFVLMLEGAVLFAGAATRRLGDTSPGELSFPFSVRASSAGYPGAAAAEEGDARAELWLPVWNESAGIAEVKALMSEGRARIGKRGVRSGVDFARAVASLGVDRGLASFERYAFLSRNGRSFYAVPVGKFPVRRRPEVELLNEIDSWLLRFGNQARRDRTPSAVGRALRRLEDAIIAMAQRDSVGAAQAVLVALGACDEVLGRSFAWASAPLTGVQPIPFLNSAWRDACDDESVEFRLACALASIHRRFSGIDNAWVPLRAHLAPIGASPKGEKPKAWWPQNPSNEFVWSGGQLETEMLKVFAHRLIRAQQSGDASYTEHAAHQASLSDISAFIEGRTDDRKLHALVRGLALVNAWSAPASQQAGQQRDALAPDAAYGVMKLCFATHGVQVPITPAIAHRAAAGDALALSLAIRRLRASGAAPRIAELHMSGPALRRRAAALLFPISKTSARTLSDGLINAPNHSPTPTETP